MKETLVDYVIHYNPQHNNMKLKGKSPPMVGYDFLVTYLIHTSMAFSQECDLGLRSSA